MNPSAEPPRPAPEPVPSALPTPPRPVGVWSANLRTAPRAAVWWLWRGYLAPGNVTLLTSQWKSGKTTLLSVLLARRVAGGTLAARPPLRPLYGCIERRDLVLL